MKKLNLKNEKGITLVALVVTIIVLIILAGVSINLVLGERGILSKAREGRSNYQVAANEEIVALSGLDAEMETNIEGFEEEDTVWQNAFKTSYNYDMYVLDEEKKTITLRSGPGVNSESIEIKKYAVIDGVKYETKFPDRCTNIFHGNNLKTISIDADVDTSNITDATGMFVCSSITTINAPNLITNKTTNMYEMFDGCKNLTNLNISGWDTSNVTDMSRLFYNCYSLKTLDLSDWNTSNVIKMEKMFYMDDSDTYESQLTTIYVSNKFVTNKVVDLYGRGYATANLFGNTKKLVGGNGSTYYHTADNGGYDLWGIEGARIDTAETPGLFTAK